MKPNCPFVLALALVGAVSTSAQSDSNTIAHVERMVIQGTRLPSAAEEVASPVTIVDREMIVRLQQRLVADALRGQPGLDVARTGQPGGLTTVFLRGANNSHTLVLIDGVRVNNGFNNAFDFNNLPVENIERIEILRGPQSTLYGSEALGGVINIITRRGGEPFGGSVTAEYGTHDTWLMRGAVALREGKFSLSAEGGYSTSDNERINSDYANWNFSGRAAYQFSEQFSVSFLANYLHSEAGSPNDRFTDDPNDRLKNENRLFVVTFDARPAAWWESQLTLSHAHERGLFLQPEPNPPYYFGDYESLLVAQRSQADFQNVFHLAERHRVLAGGTYERSEGDFADTYGAVEQAVATRSLYAQYEYAPGPAWLLTAGGRVDDADSFGAHWTWKTGGRHTLTNWGTILRANVGTGFRAPSISQLYYPFFGNPDLRPEESLGWDVGLEQPLAGDRVRLAATFFHNDFDNLINGFPPANVARARTLGVETVAMWTPLTNLTLRASYTWLEAEDRITGLQLERRPEHRGSVRADYDVCRGFSVLANALFTGARPDQDFSTFPSTRVTLTAYTKLDLGFTARVCRNFSLFGRVENLLDENYEEAFGFPALGRIFAIGASARF